MTIKILIINGPNLNLLGEREQSQYGTKNFEELKNECKKKADELGIKIDIVQSNIEGEIVSFIQDARNKYNGIIINAAGFTHTSVAIRDALEIFKQIFFISSKLMETYCDCSLSPNRFRFGPLIIKILLLIC